jgi:hypothetical protein
VTEQSALAPFILDEADAAQASHCLTLFDGDMEEVEDVFEKRNAEGNGRLGEVEAGGVACPSSSGWRPGPSFPGSRP